MSILAINQELQTDIDITITLSSGTVIIPLITSITWTTERKGSCGVLEFEVLKEQVEFTEGNRVNCKYKGVPFFMGYIFKRSRDKSGVIKVTAYDQLRYLKNKDTYTFTNVTATDIIKRICDDFNLQIGELDDTGYKLPRRIEDDKTLLDMILYALTETLYYTQKNYIFYDDYGKITLKEDEKLRILDVVVDEETGVNYDYQSSIDDNTYNQIKLSRVSENKSKRDIFIVKDPYNIENWGILQYFENIDDNTTDEMAKDKVEKLLELYNHKRRSFRMIDLFGDVRVRGGSSMYIRLNVGDIMIQNFMIVNKVVHKWEKEKYTMDVEFIGAMGKKGSDDNQ